MRALVLALLPLLAACGHAVPSIRPGPPLHVGFGPPPGDAQLEIAKQERVSEVRFPGRPAAKVDEVIRTSQRETWKLLRDGTWRLDSMVMDEEATRDGVAVGSAVPLRGVPFTTVVDATGAFVRAEDVAETVRMIEERVPSKALRKLVEPLLTPALLDERLRLAWTVRVRGLCQRDFTPGEVFYALDRQDLPAGGPAISVVRVTVIGATQEGLQPAMELALEFGGASSPLAREPAAQALLAQLHRGESLVERVKGHGRRLVALSSCQVIAEDAAFEGAWKLNREAIGTADPASFPEEIRFEVRRGARRLTGAEARLAQPMP